MTPDECTAKGGFVKGDIGDGKVACAALVLAYAGASLPLLLVYTQAGRRLEDVATGELVAFNELVIGHDPAAASHQEDTLVLREHRGHKLGQLVKCAGLTVWRRDIAPRSPKVITYNAEENRPMLAVCRQLGFTARPDTEDPGVVKVSLAL